MHPTSRAALGGCALAVLLSAATATAPAAALPLQRVALTGDEAPGTGGAAFLGFGPVVTNDFLRTAFTATLEQAGGVGPDDDLGMWSEGGGALALVLRQGSAAAGAAGTWDVATAPPALNDAGQLAFRASVSGPSQSGVWHEGSGALAPAALTGEPADGLPVGVDTAGPLSEPAFNDAGQVAFHGGLSGAGVSSTDDRAVWAGGPGGPLGLAAREGDLAPGSGGAAYVGFEGTLVDASGGVAFRATLDDGGTGIYAGPVAALQLAARDGSPAPGVPGGVFASFIAPDLGPAGALAFHAGLASGPGGVTSADDRGVWAGAPDALKLVAREGELAPDSGGRVFSSFSTPRINAGGDVLFRGFLDAGTGLFVDRPATGLAVVAASGDPAPGTDLGLGDASFAAFSDWALNDTGQIAFEATLAGALQGVTGANDGSLWLLDDDGTLHLVMREGTALEVGAGDIAIVESIDFTGDSATRGRGVAHDVVAFGVTFTDGREAVYLPEPGGPAVLALGSLALGALGCAARQRTGAYSCKRSARPLAR